MRMARRLLYLLILFLFFPVPAFAQAQDTSSSRFTVRVVSVANGDTITALKGNQQINIRLYGINCPEKKQVFGNRAREATARLVHGKDVIIHHLATDMYGRSVAIVEREDEFILQNVLLSQGLAWFSPQYCKRQRLCDDYRALEELARTEKRGLWADKSPWNRGNGGRGNHD